MDTMRFRSEMPSDTLLYKEMEYEFTKIVQQVVVEDEFLKQIPLRVIVDKTAYGMMNILISWEVAKRDMLHYYWPRDWWQAFKERWFPKWAKKMWRVQYRYITLSELATVNRMPEQSTIKVRYIIDQGY